MKKILLLIRRGDLRMHDNPALQAAARSGGILPVFIWDKQNERLGAAAKWWLHEALGSYMEQMDKAGASVVLKAGDTARIVQQMAAEENISAVYWNRHYPPAVYQADQKMAEELEEKGIEAKTFEGDLLLPPWETRKKDNSPYKVFTPFYKNIMTLTIPKPLPEVEKLTGFDHEQVSLSLEELSLISGFPWHDKLSTHWTVSEQAGLNRLHRFAEEKMNAYEEKRDLPAADSCSGLSPYLAAGQLSPRYVYHYVLQSENSGADFLRQLIWREFSWHVLFHFPDTLEKPFNPAFRSFEWFPEDKEHIHCWQKGETGFDFVDAGMKEMWETGVMHNRVRMLAASFFTKHLLQHWTIGMRYFEDCLVDLDVASNVMGWQWTAGTGVDAAPYFRIFNPELQAKKFDPDSVYIKKWLSGNQPQKIVDHQAARKRALDRYNTIKK